MLSIKCSGLYPHFRQSRNPHCEEYRIKLDGGALLPNNEGDAAISGARMPVDAPKDSAGEHNISGVDDTIAECQSGCTS
jgi:hypothetical protein